MTRRPGPSGRSCSPPPRPHSSVGWTATDRGCAAEAAVLARMLRSLLVGLVIEHVAGVLDGGRGSAGVFRARAEEIASVLERPLTD